jgi:hypothetical protein
MTRGFVIECCYLSGLLVVLVTYCGIAVMHGIDLYRRHYCDGYGTIFYAYTATIIFVNFVLWFDLWLASLPK